MIQIHFLRIYVCRRLLYHNVVVLSHSIIIPNHMNELFSIWKHLSHPMSDIDDTQLNLSWHDTNSFSWKFCMCTLTRGRIKSINNHSESIVMVWIGSFWKVLTILTTKLYSFFWNSSGLLDFRCYTLRHRDFSKQLSTCLSLYWRIKYLIII